MKSRLKHISIFLLYKKFKVLIELVTQTYLVSEWQVHLPRMHIVLIHVLHI